MKCLNQWVLFVIACGLPVAATAQLQLLPDKEPQRVFAGDQRKIALVWHNASDIMAQAGIRARILQTSSATAIRLGEIPWKKLQVLPQQTVVESARLDFPPAKAETKFLIQWLEGSNNVIGKTEVLVYPTNLLDELKLIVDEDEKNLGVLDPSKQLKPLLKSSATKFVDLEETELDTFTGKLAIVSPCSPNDPERKGLANRISKLARNGTPVVWIQPPSKRQDKIQPSFYIVPQGRAIVVVVQPELAADLPDNPQSQLNLIHFCKLAVNPQPAALPDLSPQP